MQYKFQTPTPDKTCDEADVIEVPSTLRYGTDVPVGDTVPTVTFAVVDLIIVNICPDKT